MCRFYIFDIKMCYDSMEKILNSFVQGEATKKSSCTSFKDALRGYRDILRVATGIAENFFEEKISYLKSKNRQLAALRDIEDQIKSDCEFLQQIF